MDKCNCYKEVNRIVGWYAPNSPMIKKFPVCIGTKEQESCQCKGNKLHCDFYPEIRDHAEKDRKKQLQKYKDKLNEEIEKMKQTKEIIENNTPCQIAEDPSTGFLTRSMLVLANINDKTYISNDKTLKYSSKTGFVPMSNCPYDIEQFNKFLALSWEEYNPIKLTRVQAEEKFNVEIID